MNDFSASGGSTYPEVENLLTNDPTSKSEAVYVPSVTPSFAIAAYTQKWTRPLPEDVAAREMNFLDPENRLFRLSHVMSSAGQALDQKVPCILTERDRKYTLLIGDSGGYQIANSGLQISGDEFREKTLRWLEANADVAMTLDVPTAPLLTNKDYKYKSSKECLTATLENLEYFRKHRKEGKVVFLNVLQGNTTAEADAWYEAVKSYDFEGWALAGKLRNNFTSLCRRILRMADDNQLQNKRWIHVLGTNELATGVCLTALQRAINMYINPKLRISYDTSTPFRMLSWRQVYSLPRFDKDKMVLPPVELLDDAEYAGSELRWPWPSPFGNRLKMKDIVVSRGRGKPVSIDTQGYHYVAYHNLGSLCDSVALANRIFDCTGLTHQHRIAMPVGAAVEAIYACIKSGSAGSVERYRGTFDRLRKETPAETEDDQDRTIWN